MVEILKKGKSPLELTYDHTCKICKTRFRFAYSEGQRMSDNRDGDYLTIDCPICKNICIEAV
jgi:hypothetical protein